MWWFRLLPQGGASALRWLERLQQSLFILLKVIFGIPFSHYIYCIYFISINFTLWRGSDIVTFWTVLLPHHGHKFWLFCLLQTTWITQKLQVSYCHLLVLAGLQRGREMSYTSVEPCDCLDRFCALNNSSRIEGRMNNPVFPTETHFINSHYYLYLQVQGHSNNLILKRCILKKTCPQTCTRLNTKHTRFRTDLLPNCIFKVQYKQIFTDYLTKAIHIFLFTSNNKAVYSLMMRCWMLTDRIPSR